MNAIPVSVAIILCLTAAGVVSWDLAPLILKPRVRRPAATANPEGPPPFPASGADPATRDDLTVIHAGGMLLPDRPRTVYEPGPFRIPPYYLKYEAEQAERWWSE